MRLFLALVWAIARMSPKLKFPQRQRESFLPVCGADKPFSGRTFVERTTDVRPVSRPAQDWSEVDTRNSRQRQRCLARVAFELGSRSRRLEDARTNDFGLPVSRLVGGPIQVGVEKTRGDGYLASHLPEASWERCAPETGGWTGPLENGRLTVSIRRGRSSSPTSSILDLVIGGFGTAAAIPGFLGKPAGRFSSSSRPFTAIDPAGIAFGSRARTGRPQGVRNTARRSWLTLEIDNAGPLVGETSADAPRWGSIILES